MIIRNGRHGIGGKGFCKRKERWRDIRERLGWREGEMVGRRDEEMEGRREGWRERWREGEMEGEVLFQDLSFKPRKG